MGLAGYYRRFIKNFGTICRPLTALLQKETKFLWTPEAADAFAVLKKAMSSPPTLGLPNFADKFIIETDTSSTGMGAVLVQQGRPLAFASKALGARQQSSFAYERELMAMIFAIQQWRSYLVGRTFVIRMDHLPLKHLLEQRSISPEQLKWVNKL